MTDLYDEPTGIPPRGTLIVLTGRGETTASYGRFGRRLASDAYRIRIVEVSLEDLDGARKQVEALLDDPELPAPRVLVGSDTGATYAVQLARELDQVDAAVLAGLALPESVSAVESWEEELEARTGCPTHRRIITEDESFSRGALSQPVPEDWTVGAPGKPVLVIHGSADPVTPSAAAFEPFRDVKAARLRLVVGGRHDALNDLTHRSVAATVVLFLESLKLGAELPVIVGSVQG